MTNEQWHYEWVKTLVNEGVPVESALMAFREKFGPVRAARIDEDATHSAKTFLQLRKEIAAEAT